MARPSKNSLRFIYSTFNEEGKLCETYGKDWHPFGMSILYEEHADGCSCSYCDQKESGNWGIDMPTCRCRNSWRVIWWRRGKWPYRYFYIRWTLPQYPFKWWNCRHCKKEKSLL